MEIAKSNNGHKGRVTWSWPSCRKEGWPGLEGQEKYVWGLRVEDKI